MSTRLKRRSVNDTTREKKKILEELNTQRLGKKDELRKILEEQMDDSAKA